MNLFNRILVVAMLALLIVAGLVLVSTPDLLLAKLQEWTVEATVTPQDRINSAVIGAVLIILGGAALYVELRQEPHSTVVVSKMSDGAAALEVASVALRIRQQVEALDGIQQVIPHITGQGRAVAVRLVVITSTEVDVPAKAAEIGAVVRECAEKMGVAVGKQDIRLRYEPATKPAMRT